MGKNIFNSVSLSKPKKNRFDLTHDVKLTARMGNLVPIMALETVPGDKFNIGAESLVRFAPLVAPVMHRFDVTMHYFFVPNRILWDGWEKWISDPTGTVAHPYLELNNTLTADQLRFLDYMGIPPVPAGYGNATQVNALAMAAYQAIYHEYYRDQNLVPEFNYKLTSGNNVANLANLLTLRKRAWEHDYFTAALPFAQKGEDVSIPLGAVTLDNTKQQILRGNQGLPLNTGDTLRAQSNTGNLLQGQSDSASTVNLDPNGSLQVESTTIRDLRRAFRLQEWLERNATGGTRYIENLLVHFGVHSSDKRLQRPEYITGVKTPVVISEVLNTTGQVFPEGQTGEGLPQGNMAGHAISVGSGNHGRYFCEEHGYIIGIMSVMPKTAYQQGIPRHYLKNDTLDYYWPSFANIGEQEVQLRELYAYPGNGSPTDTFGYVPRYAEYKYMPNRVAGDFRGNLSYWHQGRIFDADPALNQEFIECNPDDRIFAVQDANTDNLFIQVLNRVSAVRPMPVFGTPYM